MVQVPQAKLQVEEPTLKQKIKGASADKFLLAIRESPDFYYQSISENCGTKWLPEWKSEFESINFVPVAKTTFSFHYMLR